MASTRNRGGDKFCGGGGSYWMTGLTRLLAEKGKGVGFSSHIYKPPKNLLKLTTSELPLEEEPVLLLLVRL
jgi:hypothetical protein